VAAGGLDRHLADHALCLEFLPECLDHIHALIGAASCTRTEGNGLGSGVFLGLDALLKRLKLIN